MRILQLYSPAKACASRRSSLFGIPASTSCGSSVAESLASPIGYGGNLYIEWLWVMWVVSQAHQYSIHALRAVSALRLALPCELGAYYTAGAHLLSRGKSHTFKVVDNWQGSKADGNVHHSPADTLTIPSSFHSRLTIQRMCIQIL